MKKSIQLYSRIAKAGILAVVLTAVSAISSQAAEGFVVYLKTENISRTFTSPGEVKFEKDETKEYIIWNLENSEFRTIYLHMEDRTFYVGRDREWNWNTKVEDNDSGNQYSVLSIFGAPGVHARQDVYADSMQGILMNREIENGANPRRAWIAKVYRGHGQMELVSPEVDMRNWYVKTMHMKLSENLTKSVNDKKLEKLADAQQTVVDFLEEAGWEEVEH